MSDETEFPSEYNSVYPPSVSPSPRSRKRGISAKRSQTDRRSARQDEQFKGNDYEDDFENRRPPLQQAPSHSAPTFMRGNFSFTRQLRNWICKIKDDYCFYRRDCVVTNFCSCPYSCFRAFTTPS